MIARSKETMIVEIASETAATIPCKLLRCPTLDSGFEGTELAILELLRISFELPKSAFSPASCKGTYGLSKPFTSPFPGSFVLIVSAVCIDSVSHLNSSGEDELEPRSTEIAENGTG